MSRTPFIEWNVDIIKNNIHAIHNLADIYDIKLLFPVKTFPHKKILSLFYSYGFGFDCSNSVEIELVRRHFPKSVISATGPLLTSKDYNKVQYFDISAIHNLESYPKRKKGIRVNLNKDNFAPSRFGLCDITDLENICKMYPHQILGIHIHISDIKDKQFIQILKRHKNTIRHLKYVNIGGSYATLSAKQLKAMFKRLRLIVGCDVEILFEAGDIYFIGASTLYTKVLDINSYFPGKRFITLDVSKHIHCNWSTPQYIDSHHSHAPRLKTFFFGASCSEQDFMQDCLAPAEIKIGAILKFGKISCYSYGLNTSFNGIPKIRHCFHETNK